MKIETMNHTGTEAMVEEYLDEFLLETIEHGIIQPNQTIKQDVSQDSSIYEEYLDVKPTIPIQQSLEVPFIINGHHQGFFCNVCRREIYGFRYVCMQCADWDMCASCEARSEHPAHYVLRLPAPRPYAEVQFAINTVRREFVEKSPSEIRIKKEVVGDMFTEHAESNVKKPQITKIIQPTQKQSYTGGKPDTVKAIDTTVKTNSPSTVRLPVASTTQYIPINKTPEVKPYFNNKTKLHSKPSSIKENQTKLHSKPSSIKENQTKLHSKPSSIKENQTKLHSKPSSIKDSPLCKTPHLKVKHASTLHTIPPEIFENIKKKSSPVRKKRESSSEKNKKMLKFVLPRGVDSKHLLLSLKNGLRVKLDRLPEAVITQFKSKR